MRTTVDLPDTLLADVARLTGATTKKAALRIALEEYVRSKRIEALLALPGTIEIDYVRPEMEELELAELRASGLLATSGAPNAQAATSSKPKAKVAERRKRYR